MKRRRAASVALDYAASADTLGATFDRGERDEAGLLCDRGLPDGCAGAAGFDADRPEAVSERDRLRALARRRQAGRADAGRFAGNASGRPAPHGVRPDHHPPRPRSGRIPAKLPAVLRSHGLYQPHAERRARAQDACGAVPADRSEVWRAGAGARRLLGAGDRLGTNVGKMSILRSVTTLAFDCRGPSSSGRR